MIYRLFSAAVSVAFSAIYMQTPFNMSYTIVIFSPNHNLETINCRGIVIIYKMHLYKLGGEGEKGGEN